MIGDDYTYVLDSLKVHKELQESILRDIARRLVKNPGLLTDTASWQAEKLQQAGLLFDDITEELSKATRRQKEEIKAAFDEAETKVFDYEQEVLTKAGFDPEEFKKLSPSMQQTWTASLAKTSTEAINLTKTTALTSQSAYIEACDLAMMQVQSGAFDYNTAIKNACVAAGAKGVNVVYPSGWVDKLDTAIRRSTLTGVSQTAGKLQEMRADDMEQDIMELSAHAGARPDHADWQGRLVSRSGKPGYLSLADIGYGTVRGFKGPNCKHEWFIFFEGISKRAYTEEQLEEFKNETVTYDGKDIPLWKATEYQRTVERAVKSTKRQLVVLDEAIKNATSDELKAELKAEFSSKSVLLKRQEARLKDFCKQTGIYYDNSRLQVFTQATENGIKNWGKSVSSKAVWANKKSVDNSVKSGIIKAEKGIDMHIDKFTPCLENAQTGEILSTSFSLASKEELKQLSGWKFNWIEPELDKTEIYKLTLANDNEIQGLVALSPFERDRAMYINIVESAPHNLGANKRYNGVGGHLYAIAAQKSVDNGFNGFIFMDAKNWELVEHYEKTLGAILIGRPHPYRMIIDEKAAHKLLKIYTLKED